MPEVVNTMDEDGYVLVKDAIGQGVDVRLYEDRGILSLVFVVDDLEMGPSAEVQLEDFEKALTLIKAGV